MLELSLRPSPSSLLKADSPDFVSFLALSAVSSYDFLLLDENHAAMLSVRLGELLSGVVLCSAAFSALGSGVLTASFFGSSSFAAVSPSSPLCFRRSLSFLFSSEY